jgi:hypothetical protein
MVQSPRRLEVCGKAPGTETPFPDELKSFVSFRWQGFWREANVPRSFTSVIITIIKARFGSN